MTKRSPALLAILLLAGCESQTIKEIGNAPAMSPHHSTQSGTAVSTEVSAMMPSTRHNCAAATVPKVNFNKVVIAPAIRATPETKC